MKKKTLKKKQVKKSIKQVSLIHTTFDEASLKIDASLFKEVIDNIADILIVIDPKDYSVLAANENYLKKEGLSLAQIRKKKCYEITHRRSSPCMPPRDRCPLAETLKTRKVAKCEHVHHGVGERTYYSEIITYPIFDKQNKIKAVVHLSRDITERKKMEEDKKRYVIQLKELALRDPHTGIYNYRYLMDRLSSEVDLAGRHSLALSVLLVDIDYFKSINDVYGHQAGNRLLSDFANFIKDALRRSDVLTRYGGEEFVIVMPQTDKKNAMNLANRLVSKINSKVFVIDRNHIKIKASIGVAEFSLENELTTAKSIINAADKALHRAKEAGSNRAVAFSNLYRSVRKREVKTDYKQEVEILKNKISKLGQRVDQTVLESMYAFSKSLEARDCYTAEHADRMIDIALRIGKKLGLKKSVLEDLERAAVLHDIGKIGISDAILRKKSKLTAEEFKIIKTHPQIGAEIIRAVHFLRDVAPIIMHHHEKLDGTGYPSGLSNGEIPLNARIIAIADAYQALTSDRPYRKAYSKKKAFDILKQESGAHFDGKIVNILINMELLKKTDPGKLPANENKVKRNKKS